MDHTEIPDLTVVFNIKSTLFLSPETVTNEAGCDLAGKQPEKSPKTN
jgi:hypothetical protein